MNVDVDEVEELLIGLILEGRIEGRIDQVAMRLELESKYVSRPPYPGSWLTHTISVGIASRRRATALWINGAPRSSRYTRLSLGKTTAAQEETIAVTACQTALV